MLKRSSLCLYSSNLGTFWLKIEQFWPFEEISIFSNSGHLDWRAGLSDTISNFVEMILEWPPSKIVSVDPDFEPRWPPS
jgi:hypothetical protein